MAEQPQAVFFDLDGTLIDTAPDFYTVLNATLQDAGRDLVSYNAVREQVSNGARAMVGLGFGLQPGDADFDLWLNRFLDRYEQHLAVDTVLFPGMAEVLER
ncbi:MAG: HAD hydrolase-like protein, partial [Alcanivoracaceae bacterium]|nr:HAD hydrolase-like protein [Alcanivoracaceae bacterium]